MFTDVKVIPTLPLRNDLNSYALDFFKHGQENAIMNENYLQSGQAFQLVKDFMLVIKVNQGLKKAWKGTVEKIYFNIRV